MKSLLSEIKEELADEEKKIIEAIDTDKNVTENIDKLVSENIIAFNITEKND